MRAILWVLWETWAQCASLPLCRSPELRGTHVCLPPKR